MQEGEEGVEVRRGWIFYRTRTLSVNLNEPESKREGNVITNEA